MLATVFVGCTEALVANRAAFSLHVLVRAVENLVFTQFAFQVAVEQRIVDRWTQTDEVGELTIRNHPCVVALEHEFEFLAQSFVEFVDVLIFQAFAVRRVGHHHALFRCFFPVGECALLQFNHLAHASTLDVGFGNGDSLHSHIGAVDFVFKFTLLAVVVIDRVEKFGIVVAPVLESELLAIHARVDVGGNHSSLHQECARTTHRVHEVALTVPATQFNDTSGKHFIDRRFGLSHTPATLIERRARRVERNGHLVGRNVHIQHEISSRHTDRGTLAHLFLEIVNDGIFHAIGDKARMTEHIAKHGGVDGESLVGA